MVFSTVSAAAAVVAAVCVGTHALPVMPSSADAAYAIKDFPPAVANSIYSASEHVTHVGDFKNGRRFKAVYGDVSVDGPVSESEFNIIHVYGDAKERGHAHGLMMAPEVFEMIEDGIPQFLLNMLEDFKKQADGKLPAALAKLADKILDWAESNDEALLDSVLLYIYNLQRDFIKNLPEHLVDEMMSIGAGACEGIPSHKFCKRLSLVSMGQRVLIVNFLPEMLKMTCTIVGAKSNATPQSSGLVQLRALDFGGGPFANRTLLVVHHPTDVGNKFASLAFPATSLVVTGWSEKIALSEKVWETYEGSGIQAGTYKGEAVVMVMRQMLQSGESTAHAIDIARHANRTFAVFLGVGDFNNNFNIIGYKEKSFDVYTDVSMPSVTKQTMLTNVTYVDKHPQPSHMSDLPEHLQKLTGTLDGDTMAKEVPRMHQTGDVHIAVYDFAAREAIISIGITDTDGNYATGMKAYERPYLKFKMDDLWSVAKP